MDPSSIVAFAAVSTALIAAPGPSVLFAVGRALAAGRRVALLTVLGNVSGLFAQVVVVALGLGVLVSGSGAASVGLRLTGAIYLLWLGVAAIRHRHDAARSAQLAAPSTPARPWRDGLVVGVTNPKSLIFLAALLPQYVQAAAGPPVLQMIGLGALFCGLALVSDGAWAILAARARQWLARDPRRLAWAAVAGGLAMVALGLLLLVG